MNHITQYVLADILRNKIVIVYTVVLAALSFSVFSLENNSTKGLLTLLNVILLTVPLVSIIFSTIYIYNSAEFILLLVSQPIKRSRIWRGLFSGLSLSLIISFLVGVGIPLFVYNPLPVAGIMTLLGSLVTFIFTAIAFFSSIYARDKARGIGVSIMLWLWFALLFDGLVLFLLFQFSDYPIEKAMLIINAFNPLSLARILILLHLDVSAMLGYAGALFRQYFGTAGGFSISLLLLLFWACIPFSFSLRRFRKKDL